eukprot:61074-Prorocentrum_minimum.AAC.1
MQFTALTSPSSRSSDNVRLSIILSVCDGGRNAVATTHAVLMVIAIITAKRAAIMIADGHARHSVTYAHRTPAPASARSVLGSAIRTQNKMAPAKNRRRGESNYSRVVTRWLDIKVLMPRRAVTPTLLVLDD